MEDILFVTKCNHKIKNYKLHIVKESDGAYTAEFPCDIVMDKRYIFIRSWDTEQNYIDSVNSYTEIPTTIKNTSTVAPVSGVSAEIGIQDYIFISNKKIQFTDTNGEYPVVVNDELVPQPEYLVDFVADPKTCPRCLGTGVVKDLNINNAGSLTKVTGGQKIKQRVLKALITPLGMSPYDNTFGSELNLMVGNVITDTTRITLQKTITNCIQNLIDNQPEDLDASETIQTIGGITLDTPTEDKTALYVQVIVISATGEYIDCSIGFDLGE